VAASIALVQALNEDERQREGGGGGKVDAVSVSGDGASHVEGGGSGGGVEGSGHVLGKRFEVLLPLTWCFGDRCRKNKTPQKSKLHSVFI
jgi:hypothetical protein